MEFDPIRVLLVEDHLAEARLLQELLSMNGLTQFEVSHVNRLQAAIVELTQQSYQVVLLDLTLPDSYELASLERLIALFPKLPIVVLTNTNDENLAIEAMRRGAQDYLVKRSVNGEVLVRSLRYAVERKQISEALQAANTALEQRVQERTTSLQQEIQQRQRIQERLELAQKVCKIGSFEWDLQTNELVWTAELEMLYGLEPGGFAGNVQAWLQLIHPDDRDRVHQDLEQAVSSHTLLDTEFQILPTARWIAVRGSVFYSDSGQPLRMLGINTDITERKQLEAQFLRAQRLESIGTLASGIAHDLNNILTPILAIAQLLPLKLPQLDSHNRELLKTLEISSKRGAEIVKQILSFARGATGKPVQLNVAHVLMEIERILHETLPKSIEIHQEIAQTLPIVMGDATQLQQVLMNLCVNARDAMPAGGRLSLEARVIDIDAEFARHHLDAKVGAYLQVVVSDSGIGIPVDLRDRIFDPFFTTKAVGQGTGLGLSAAMGIIRSHGGFIDLESEVGQGSRFMIYLPIVSVPTSLAPVELKCLTGQAELILVVDDEVAICEVAKTTLETHNYRVLTARDGEEAIALYAQHQQEISSVLLDLMMPDLDGLAAIPRLRQLNPALPIIAMTGQSSSETLHQVQNARIQGLLRKPFTSQELLQTLHQVTAAVR
jgi:PAS domain S-box-containing protein